MDNTVEAVIADAGAGHLPPVRFNTLFEDTN